jgi:hypothetical protein
MELAWKRGESLAEESFRQGFTALPPQQRSSTAALP